VIRKLYIERQFDIKGHKHKVMINKVIHNHLRNHKLIEWNGDQCWYGLGDEMSSNRTQNNLTANIWSRTILS